VLSVELRQQDRIEARHELDVERVGPGEYRLVRRPPANQGLVDRLLRRSGRAMPIKDSLVAATALAHDLTVVTRNRVDFTKAGVRVLDPFNGKQP
jgi:hypothetical protein